MDVQNNIVKEVEEEGCCKSQKIEGQEVKKELYDIELLNEFNRFKNRVIDSHCHIHEDQNEIDMVKNNDNYNNDSNNSTASNNKEKLSFSQSWLMGTTVPDWDRVNSYASVMGDRAIRCFGIHPWFVHLVHPPQSLLETNPAGDPTKMVMDSYPTVIDSSWPEKMKQLLLQHPDAMVGEIGVDKVTKCRATGKNEQEPQWVVFNRQIEIAAELNRLVSLHCVQLHGKLLDYFIALPLARMPRKIALHTFSGKPSTVTSFAKMKEGKGSRFYFGISFINLSSSKVSKMIQAIPDNRLLLESDQNTPTEAESSVFQVVLEISKAKSWTIQQTIVVTRNNAIEFLK
ncbi:hypothetical protein PPL_02496 [Heterostelium album PN500]|uniref:TatD n=1 Tax=Heterostelium pallidum (strain ATCC 26659 / Pp 5 / PN500) TaxID=670386 RepID=D3B288_HETP5|nr:hypothetical protein PPL_02496 [Heterostelium album PN500]EFA84463.1 hypothetical protein PPL_02496 [Heterostelium album PN500]|eukprot:XP_020436577.1 hypothetical protein PPL_02496 [Heterostelium album PN500]